MYCPCFAVCNAIIIVQRSHHGAFYLKHLLHGRYNNPNYKYVCYVFVSAIEKSILTGKGSRFYVCVCREQSEKKEPPSYYSIAEYIKKIVKERDFSDIFATDCHAGSLEQSNTRINFF